jgi:molecular chaperone DnaK
MLNDVTPLSLGLETIGGVMKVLIPRNTPIPVRKSDVFSTSEANQNSVEIHVLQGERQMSEGNKSLGRFRLSGIPPAPRGVPQVQVSFDIDANGLLQVSATDRTTGRQQSVSIQGGTNLSEEEINRLLEEAEQKAAEDRRKRSEIDRRNRAQTLVSQAERRLRDAALELGPYGAERQQRSVELALRDVQDLLRSGDTAELELAVSQLQEALFGLNRRLLSERRAEAGPLQGIKNTLGSLRDELFADDDWDDWDRDGRSDPWASPARRPAGERPDGGRFETRYDSRWDAPAQPSYGLGGGGAPSSRERLERPERASEAFPGWEEGGRSRGARFGPASDAFGDSGFEDFREGGFADQGEAGAGSRESGGYREGGGYRDGRDWYSSEPGAGGRWPAEEPNAGREWLREGNPARDRERPQRRRGVDPEDPWADG